MALSDKNIVITPNRGASTEPTIKFTGADASTSATITLRVVNSGTVGTLSFEGTSGQLFSMTDSMSGTIFSVNDVSGIPSIEVLDTGLVKLAQYNGQVTISTSTAISGAKFTVQGGAVVNGTMTATLFSGVFSGSLSGAASSTTAALTMNNSGAGAASGTTFNGSTAQTISYNTVGAPSAAGANASGSWGISVTGNAATVTMSSGRTDVTAYPVVWGTTGGTSQLYSATAVNIQSSTGLLTATTLAAKNLQGAAQVMNFDTIKAPGLYHYDSGITGTPPTASPNFRTIEIGTTDRYSQIALPWDSSNMYFRYNNGTWQAWQTVLHSGNYNSYAPTLTGTGASGSWNISITGSAGTATDSTKLPLAGGIMTGNILFGDSGLAKRGIEGTVGGSDYWFVGGGATATNSGWMEIATGDDGNSSPAAEPIMVSQYGPGDPLTGTLFSRAFLATKSNNTTFPNNFGIGFNKTAAPYSETEPVAKLTVVSSTSAAANTQAWASAHSVFGPNANSPTGAALGLGYNTTSDASEIISLAPSLAWKPLNLFSAGLNVYSSYGGLALIVTPTGAVAFGTSATAYGTAGQILQSNGNTSPTWVSASGLVPTAIKTGAYTAVASDLVRVNSAAGVFTVTLPASPADGDKIGVFDVTNSCATNIVSVAANGKTIESDPTSLSINIAGALIVFLYNSATSNWKAQIIPISAVNNIGGGTIGQLLYQVSPGLTSFVGPGTAGQVLISAGATSPTYTSSLFVSGSNNIGIGTSSPTTRLQVAGGSTTEVRVTSSGDLTAGAASLIRFGGSNNQISGYAGYGGTASTFDIWNTLAGAITFGTSNTERMRIDSGGNVGIGTTAPATALHVVGTDSSANRTNVYNVMKLTAESAQLPYNGFGTGLVFAARAYTSGIVDSARISAYVSNDSVQNTGGSLGFDVSATVGGSLTRAVTIDYSGKVGIGTTTPASKLDVSGGTSSAASFTTVAEAYGPNAVSVRATVYDVAGTIVRISSSSNAVNSGALINFNAYNTSGGACGVYAGAVAGSTGNGPASFVIGQRTAAQAWAETFRVDTSGFVGIGTATPVGKLHVVGSGYFTGDVYSSYSDIRLKTVVGKIESAVDKVLAIETFYYEPNEIALALGATPGRCVGVNAQSVEAVQPEVVNISPLSSDYKTVQYERLVPLLIESIKELRATINKQQEQIDMLINKAGL